MALLLVDCLSDDGLGKAVFRLCQHACEVDPKNWTGSQDRVVLNFNGGRVPQPPWDFEGIAGQRNGVKTLGFGSFLA